MQLNFGKQSDIGICAALCILMSLPFRAENGVSTVGDIIEGLALDVSQEPNTEEALVQTESYLALKRMAKNNAPLCALVIHMYTRSLGYHADGLRAAVFCGRAGNYICYCGTGAGEWNDNAVALLGLPQTNVSHVYNKKGEITGATIYEEYASTQQAQAYDYFLRVAAQMNWNAKNNVIVTGHSKGGNKGQFITMKSPIVKACYSFCGQGFAPEAVAHYQQILGEDEFNRRCQKIYSLNSCNDFVNVLGERIVPDDQVYYFDTVEVVSTRQYHELASFIGTDGAIMPQTERREISLLAQNLWKDTLASPDRRAISMSVMTLCEHYFGNGIPINGDYISNQTFYRGGRAAMGIIVRALANTLWQSGRSKLSDGDRSRLSKYYEELVKPRADSIRASSFGQVVGKTFDRIRRQKPKNETSQKDIQTGTIEPFFSADPNALQLNAARIKRVRQKMLDLCVTADNMEESDLAAKRRTQAAVKRMYSEDARLQNVEQHLLDIAQAFEQNDVYLAQLAGFVL